MKLQATLQQAAIKLGKLGLAGMIILAVILGGGIVFAQEKTDSTNTGQVAQPLTIDLKTSLKATINKESSAEPQDMNLTQDPVAVNTSSATFGSLALSVQVDQTYCGSGGVQCTGPGLSTVIPAATNRNPVRFVLQVLNGTTPVNGLTDADINIINPFVPAGGTSVTQLSCGTCFQPAGNGLYAIFINPAGVANWKSGSYHVQVQVKVGARTHRALAQIEIPF